MSDRVKEAFADCLRQGMNKHQEASVLRLYDEMKAELDGAAAEATSKPVGVVSPDTSSSPVESDCPTCGSELQGCDMDLRWLVLRSNKKPEDRCPDPFHQPQTERTE